MLVYTFDAAQVDTISDLLNVTGKDLAFHIMDYYFNLQIDNIEKSDDGIHNFFAELDGKKIAIIFN